MVRYKLYKRFPTIESFNVWAFNNISTLEHPDRMWEEVDHRFVRGGEAFFYRCFVSYQFFDYRKITFVFNTTLIIKFFHWITNLFIFKLRFNGCMAKMRVFFLADHRVHVSRAIRHVINLLLVFLNFILIFSPTTMGMILMIPN